MYIGGDSAGVAGWSLTVRADSKVFQRNVPHIGPAVFGFTSSFRMGQIIRYAFEPPAPHNECEPADVDAYLVGEFIPALRRAFDVQGYEQKDNGRAEAGTFLLGLAGRLYRIESDYQVGRAVGPYDAVGCGASVALGAMYAFTGTDQPDPEAVVLGALEAAEGHNGGVRGPFSVVRA